MVVGQQVEVVVAVVVAAVADAAVVVAAFEETAVVVLSLTVLVVVSEAFQVAAVAVGHLQEVVLAWVDWHRVVEVAKEVVVEQVVVLVG